MAVTVRLLGGFDVVVDGIGVPTSAWTRRHAAALVKVLALAEGRRLHREQVVELLWPGLDLDTAGPRLHKAAHYARRALTGGSRETAPDPVVLRNDAVVLFPERDDVVVDAVELLGRGRRAAADRDVAEANAVLDLHAGELLPDDLYEPWTEPYREESRVLRHELLRLTERWEELLAEEPADEEAHLALARRAMERGDRRGAMRQLERLEQAVRRELGTAPGPAATALRARLAAAGPEVPAQRGPAVGDTVLVGRRDLGERLRRRIDEAAAGHGGPLVVSGPPGVGKTALLQLAVAHARAHGLRVARGAASAVEGPWPYAPVLEAFGDLSRSHPALLDGLDDAYREELDRALSGRAAPWSGESGHQRLFVAAAELARLAATGHGLLVVVDDVHEADEASLRLLHYLSRFARHEAVLVLMAHRPLDDGPTRRVLASLVAREADAELVVPPLSRAGMLRLLERVGTPEDARDQVADLADGIPFTALALARSARSGAPADVVPPLPPPVLHTFRRVALLGTTFTTDELLAVAGLPEEEAYRQLELAVTALLVEPTATGHRFRHHLVRDALVAQLSPSEAVAARVAVAERLAVMGAPPARVAHQLLAAGMPRRAVPFVLDAVENAGALGAYRDALALVDQVLEHAGPDGQLRLMTRRGDLLMAMGDPEAQAAYTAVLPRLPAGTEARLVRSRLARVAAFAGDLETARAAIAGLDLEGDAADGPLLLARGNIAFFTGDAEEAWQVSSRARELFDLSQQSWQLVDLISLQGLIAHLRGEWFDRFRIELRRTQGKDRLATALFDAHLCVAEFMLYGPVPYAEVMEEAEELRRRARRSGALRGVAFATALIGEAALLGGDLDRAEAELREAVELHRESDAVAGEAHGLQRLAEVHLARGDRDEAVRLLRRAARGARWSVMAMHLLQRIYGTLIAAAPDSAAALALVDEAEATLGDEDHCMFCDVMLEVPAATACADAGDLDAARRHLEAARRSAARWQGTAWPAAVAEAEAHLALAEGRSPEARRLAASAVELYEAAEQPRDAARCRGWLDVVDLTTVS